ncbi:sterile alpha motif domain-containing protein 9 [Biomphalaria glabrata]|nr:sterile alpha motif domain-containing protein 9 [Biomphalaria glabrata]
MNAAEWEKLRKNWTDICDVYPSEIVGYFYQEGVIDHKEKERIDAAETRSEKMERLLNIIQLKEGHQPFQKLLEILSDRNYFYLVQKIQDTKTESDPNLKSSADPNANNELISIILRTYYAEETGASTLLSDIRELLKKKKVFPGGNEWKNTDLSSFLTKEFLGIQIKKVSNCMKGKTTTLTNVVNLKKLDPDNLEIQTEKSAAQPASDSQETQEKKIEEKTLLEHPRKFDGEVTPTTKYKHGHIFTDIMTETRGSPLSPIKNFHLIECQDTDAALDKIGLELIPFVSACMNERRNGTIYFGVSPVGHALHKAGKIVGVSLDKLQVQEVVNCYLRESFLETQISIIRKVIREPKFIPVIKIEPILSTDLVVLEFDVIPSRIFMKKEIIKTNLRLLTQFGNNKKMDKAVFRFSESGKPELLTETKRDKFEREIPSLIEQRKEEEKKVKNNLKPDLNNKLLGVLTGGPKSLVDDIYPFVFTSEIDSHMDQDYLLQNMSFIKYLQPEVVFDFDPQGYNNGIYKNLDSLEEESMRVLTIDDFDEQKNSTENYDELVDSISCKTVSHWVFCNGYEGIDPMDKRDWNKNRRRPFVQALRDYVEQIGKDRALIIICLFSKSYETLLLASEEMLTLLPDNWILLAESEDIAKSWQERMLNEDKIEKSDIKDKCVVGLKWEQVNSTISLATKVDQSFNVRLPCSNGVLEVLPKRKLNEWKDNDIDVLTAGDLDVDEMDINNIRTEAEQKFYRGEEVQWLNFWFQDQVLEREVHKALKDAVEKALKGNTDEDKVTYVELLHQPGAGGTTTAKNILWQFRTKYRCCHVKRITEHTCDQLEEIWQFKDSTPNPLLVFIDNQDEEDCIKLKGRLEEQGRFHWRKLEESFDVFCTILECKSRASMTIPKGNRIFLTHSLNPLEKNWFDRKNDSLSELYDKDKKKVNPRFLLAFNIMRENFNPNYVQKVVRDFSKAVKSELEIELLKIVSFLNVYDPLFQPVKVIWLDTFLKSKQQMSLSRSNFFSREVKWEAKLTEGVKFFLNLSNGRTSKKKSVQSVRIMNKQVAVEILKCMKEKTKSKESDIMLSLCKPSMYRQEGKDAAKYRSLINLVAKKREIGENGKKQEFSNFVTHVQEHEGVEVVLHVLETLFEENKDAFTAQLISRVYMSTKNWQRATFYANRAVQLKPENSFLWDTAGRVIKAKLFDIIEQNKQKGEHGFQDLDILEIIDWANQGIEAFRKQQQVSEREITTMEANNVAGYVGELGTIISLLNALKYHNVFERKKNLQKYLVDFSCNPKELQFLKQHADFLKSLKGRAYEVLRRLNEEHLQMKYRRNQEEGGALQGDLSRASLIKLKSDLDCFFNENELPQTNLSDADACLYRRDKVKKLGADSLNHLLYLRKKKDGKEDKAIEDCYASALENVTSKYCSFDDLRVILDTVTVLLVDKKIPQGLLFEDVIEWSMKLYFMDQPKDIIHSYMEPFLYFVMYNFPTEERINHVCFPSDLKKAIETWSEMFKNNNPNHGKENFSLRRKVTTLFFLGNGKPLEDIVLQDTLEDLDMLPFKEKWNHPNIRQKLRLMEGILSNDGEKVNISITTKEGNRFVLPISTSHKVAKSIMWNKKVYFYLGFSFKGPRAHGMSLEKLGDIDRPKAVSDINKQSSKQKRNVNGF